MPTLTGISHVDLTVSNLDRSVAFYQDVFSLTQLFRGRNEPERFEVAYLAEPTTGTIVGLVRHDEPPEGSFSPRITGLDHLSFAVAARDDLESWAAHLDERGISHSGLSDQPPFGTGLNFSDPDGIALELYHLLPLASA